MNIPLADLRTAPASTRLATGRPDGAGDRMTEVRFYLQVLRRWRFVIAGVAAAAVILGLVITLLMTPLFTAVASVEISREANKVSQFQGVERDEQAADQEFYQTQYGLLQSRSLAERVATQLNLVDDAAFFTMFNVPDVDPALQQVDGRFSAAGRPVRQRVAGEILLANVAVEPTRLSRLVDIAFTSPDPQLSARVANAWAENFIQTNLERKVQATSYGRDLLQRQLAQFKDRLDQSQRQLVAYAQQQEIINLPAQSGGDGSSTSERSLVADELAALSNALGQAVTDRIRAEARASQTGARGTSSEALANPAINSLRQRRAELSAEYQKLMVQFEPAYPPARAIRSQIDQLDRSITQEENRVGGSIQADFREAQARERAIQARVEKLKGEFLDLRRRSIQYNIYQQEVDTNRALYDGLLQRFKEIGVAGGVGVNNVSIVDPADVPQAPSSPRLVLNLMLALLGGLVLGTAIAFVLEQIDEAVSDPDEVERVLGLPLLGTVPKLEDDGTPRDALLDRKSDLFDAYLAIQTNLAFATEHGVPKTFCVTSTRPAEGKSTTALALATSLARSNRSVILIDGDMRSPSVHHLGGVGHEVGLSSFLAGREDIEALTFRMEDMGITAMSAGPLPPNAAELLTGDRLTLLLERLLQTFDHVVIDSPPVLGLADAPLIAARVEGAVFAVESHGVRSTLIKTAIRRLDSAQVRVIGAVLTKFEARRAKYGYAYEYGYSYGRDRARQVEPA